MSDSKPKYSKKANTLTDEITGKLPPQAVELEEAVLGAILLERDAIISVLDILKPQAFYKDANQLIYQSVIELFQKNEPIDLLTVTDRLRSNGNLEKVGGAYYITQITTRVNSSANIEYHARIIIEKFLKRTLIMAGRRAVEVGYDDTVDVFESLDMIESELFEAGDTISKKDSKPISILLKETLDHMDEQEKNGGELSGVPSGFTGLDRVTGGWQNSDLVILAARPGMGKTAFVISVMRNVCVDQQISAAFFSLEMSERQVTQRLISIETEIPLDRVIHASKRQPGDMERMIQKSGKLYDAPMFVDDTPGISILELRAKARRLKHKHDIKLVVVDYLQLMNGSRNRSRDEEVGQISRGLKHLGKELDVPVIALSQLSRAVETRGGDKIPKLSDLRESGNIEQDADIVMFLYRPEYYGIDQDESGMPTANTGEVIIAKHRSGALDNITMSFTGKYTRWSDLNDPTNYSEPADVRSIHAFPSNNSFDDNPPF